MAEGIRAPNLPLGTSLSEFIGLETVGTQKSLKRFPRASVMGAIDAVTAGFQAGGGIIFTTKTQANSSLAYAANTMAWVVLDPTPANNGIYQKTGASGSGAWARLADLPYSFYRAVNEGAGTANAIVATNGYPTANKDALIVFNVTDTNTSGTVTLSLNGGAPLSIKTASGNDPAIGGFTPGMMLAGYIDNTEFRLLSDQASSAIQSAAEAAKVAAEAARDIATGAMSTFLATVFDTRATALAYSPAAAPNYIRLEGHTVTGSGGALYRKVDAEPSHPGKLSITLDDGTTIAWYEIAEKRLDPLMFGAKAETGFDCWQAFKDCLDTIEEQSASTAFRYGGPLYIPAGEWETSKAIQITTPGVRVEGEGAITSVIKAQSGITGSYVLSHSPPSTSAVMVGIGIRGVGIDCNDQVIHGYLGEMAYDNVIYDDIRISRLAASASGFVSKPQTDNTAIVNQTLDIRSLYVDKTTAKGTVPAVLIDNCQEVIISASKAWNGYGATDNTNLGTSASWFIQDCRSVTMIGCSFASSQIGLSVYANTRDLDQISILNPLFENIRGSMVVTSSSDPSSHKIRNLSIVNPRHESPSVGGYSIDAVLRGHVETTTQSVLLGADSSLVTVLTDDLSLVFDNGTNNMIHARTNSVSPWEAFGNHIAVKPDGLTHFQTSTPADHETSMVLLINHGGPFVTKKVVTADPDSGGTGLTALCVENL